jgi:hypothetical protein
VAATRPVDDTTEAFADIVYADPEIVQAEFEQLVSGLRVVATCTADSPRHTVGVRRPPRHQVMPVGRAEPRELPERVRAPPTAAAVVAAIVTTTVGRRVTPSQNGRRFSHHVDVV